MYKHSTYVKWTLSWWGPALHAPIALPFSFQGQQPDTLGQPQAADGYADTSSSNSQQGTYDIPRNLLKQVNINLVDFPQPFCKGMKQFLNSVTGTCRYIIICTFSI
jgi:hypothetical protein